MNKFKEMSLSDLHEVSHYVRCKSLNDDEKLDQLIHVSRDINAYAKDVEELSSNEILDIHKGLMDRLFAIIGEC
jgi:hypothetical protein